MKFSLANPAETEALGVRLVLESTVTWKTLALRGELGSGKTTLVRGVVQAMGGDPDDIHSPSYVLEHHYAVDGGVLLHRDAWRGDAGESSDSASDCRALIVEWPDKANSEMWPKPVLVVALEHADGGRIALVPDGVL